MGLNLLGQTLLKGFVCSTCVGIIFYCHLVFLGCHASERPEVCVAVPRPIFSLAHTDAFLSIGSFRESSVSLYESLRANEKILNPVLSAAVIFAIVETAFYLCVSLLPTPELNALN
eukprot:GHVU01037992.1.p1 GENE.GHVU01037992.1~~GHVU01037992.1.p1  ORF type:complete len:116 (-),score=9.74 GHVU01037992.1:1229-1576(-)